MIRKKLGGQLQEKIKGLLIKRVEREGLHEDVRQMIIQEMVQETDIISDLTGRNLEHKEL
jgi:hypothetical protein